jgi:hypothetical protein
MRGELEDALEISERLRELAADIQNPRLVTCQLLVPQSVCP